ncbi:hypothetical protein D1007_23083 [Hordeum vulgare]|nr:hypothetical protein D1007_23083 [Hordeum vulgare]
MFLTLGWKSLTRSRTLDPGHLLHFRFDGSATLSMKFFEVTGVCLDCRAESSSGSDIDDKSRIFDVKLEGKDSELRGWHHGEIRKARPRLCDHF